MLPAGRMRANMLRYTWKATALFGSLLAVCLWLHNRPGLDSALTAPRPSAALVLDSQDSNPVGLVQPVRQPREQSEAGEAPLSSEPVGDDRIAGEANDRPMTSGPLTLEVLVLDPSRQPAPKARVLLFTGPHQTWQDQAKTDSNGRTNFKLAPNCHSNDAFLIAEDEFAGLTSNRVELPAPQLGGTLDVILEPGAFLDVRVTESPGGMEVSGAKFFLDLDTEGQQFWGIRETDERGRARLGPFPAGTIHWSLAPPASRHQPRGSMRLDSGEVRELELHCEEGDKALAIEGRFLDVQGKARDLTILGQDGSNPDYDHPHLWVGSSITDGKSVHPDAKGRFRLYRKPCEELIVILNVGPTGHRYAPARMTVPFGTRGLELIPVETFERVTTTIKVTDAESNEPISRALVCLYLQDPMREHASLLVKEPAPGLYSMQHRDWPRLRYVVHSSGYQLHYGDLSQPQDSNPIKVALTPGLRSPVQVLDADTLAPLRGATFRNADGALVATAGSDGSAILEGSAADGKLKVEATGYHPRRWYASWFTNLVYLDPL